MAQVLLCDEVLLLGAQPDADERSYLEYHGRQTGHIGCPTPQRRVSLREWIWNVKVGCFVSSLRVCCVWLSMTHESPGVFEMWLLVRGGGGEAPHYLKILRRTLHWRLHSIY